MGKQVVIIGAGLAGCTCAYLLAQAGHDVTVLERADLSRKRKLCGGLISPRSQTLITELFGKEGEALYESEFFTMRCIAAGHVADVDSVHLRSLQRPTLDSLALERCRQAGARVFERASMRDISAKQHAVDVRLADGTERTLHYDVAIAADGALSATRKMVAGAPVDSVLSLETEIAACGSPLTALYTPELHGYCWYIPVGDRAKIGCVSYRDPNCLEDQLQQFACYMGVEIGTWKGAFIPTGKGVLLKSGDVLFLGDASGLICPPTGEGIYYALKCAKMAARAVMNSASYEALMFDDAREVAREYRMRDLFFSRRFIDVGIRAADATPYGSKRAVRWALKHFCSL